MESDIAPELWFGATRPYPTPGDACKGDLVESCPIHIKGVAGSGWKFDLVTAAGQPDQGAIGEIITTTRPNNREPYASLLYLPTLLSSGLEAGTRIESNINEFLFYMEFLYMVRNELMVRWPSLKYSEKDQQQLQVIIQEIATGLSARRTVLPLQAAAKAPGITDKIGRPNPSAASARLTAMNRRLGMQVNMERLSNESMRKRRVFAATLLQCYSQDIWDMRHMGNLRPATRAGQLQMRLDRARIKPMSFAAMYCQRQFEGNLGNPMVLPRVIEVFTAEMQLMAIRELFAGIEKQPNGHANTLHKLRVLLVMKPNEELYANFFEDLHDCVRSIGNNFRRDPELVKDQAKQAKVMIRNRASTDPNHLWFVEATALPRP